MKAKATDFVYYPVSDMARSLAYYRDFLGLELLWQEEIGPGTQWAELAAPPTTLALHASPEHVQAMAQEAQQVRGGTIALAVDDLAAAARELEAAGHKLVFPAMETPVCHFLVTFDPDGNHVCLHQRKDGTAG